MGLFRQQAVEASQDRLHGQVLLLPRLPHTLLSLFLLLWLAALLLFLTQTSYSRKETVQGWLEPVSGLVRIYPQTEGKLAQLLVGNGDPVVQGQPLAIINGDRVLADGIHLETLLLQEYQAQQRALQRQFDREAVLAQVREQELARRLQAALAELDGIHGQLDAQQGRLQLAGKRQQRHQRLSDSGHITATELESLQEQDLLMQRDLQALRVEQAQQESVISQLRASSNRLPDETANSMDLLRRQLSQLSQDIARLRGNRAYVVMASIAGEVSNLRIQAGQTVRSEQPLLSLIPANAQLEVKLLVPVRAAGFISSGQKLLLRYDAFPYQKFGLQHGEVLAVASSASLPGELTTAPFRLSEAVYRVTAAPASEHISAYGRELPLKTGMTLSADIVLEQRSLLQWLLEPIHSLRGRLA